MRKGLGCASVLGAAAGAATVSILAESRVKAPVRPLTDRWRQVPVEPRGSTLLGISFRPRQAEALGMNAHTVLENILGYPFQLVRLGAYWNQIEPGPGRFCPDELDAHVDAVERAGKRIILCVGAVKTYGYPEFFVPAHHLQQPLREGHLVEPGSYRPLVTAATEFVTRIVDRYRDRNAVVAWQVEHEAVDPLGVEHSWRLATDFVREEVEAVRTADPTRPVMMNGFLPTSLLVGTSQWWRTHDQGDSLAVAPALADIVGLDYYPRHALMRVGARTVYLDGSRSPWQQWRRTRLLARIKDQGRTLMIAEGQAEPWETVTTPPNPHNGAMFSCLPENVIENYNDCLSWGRDHGMPLWAYLFWGAEYWVLRQRAGDNRYMRAFDRVLSYG